MPLYYRPLLLAGLMFAAAQAWADPQTPGNLPAPTTPQQKSALLQMQDAFTSIAQTVEPTVVNIKAERFRLASTDASDSPSKSSLTPRHVEATGSGVIVRADGYILTNDHVVEEASGGTVTVTLADGRVFPGKVFPDYSSDLAVVKINPGPTPLPVAGFADDTAVRPGQWAIAVGSPFDLQNTMTVGVISAIGRHQTIEGESEKRYYPDLIQTDAAINPGNSGGPLFNIDGKVVGINVAIESPVEGSAGVGFAIPSGIAQTVMNSLITAGKVTRGYLGIMPEDLTPALQDEYGQKDGALVRDVKEDSPAGKAGIQAGDIVTGYDGKHVSGEVSLRATISVTPPGRTVLLNYMRDGRAGTASVTLRAASPPAAAAAFPPAPAQAAAALGLIVRTLTATDRVTLGFSPTVRGVLITGIAPGSPAEAAAVPLKRAVIQKIGHRVITSKQDYDQAVAAQPRGASTDIVVLYSDILDRQIHQTIVTL